MFIFLWTSRFCGSVMAYVIEGDGKRIHRGLMGNLPGLPPKFPTLPTKGVLLADVSAPFQGVYRGCGSRNKSHQQHKGMPSYSVVEKKQASLDTSFTEKVEPCVNRALHRYSSSDDSFTHLRQNSGPCMFGNASEGHSDNQISLPSKKLANDAKKDTNHLTGQLEEIQELQYQQNIPINARRLTWHENLNLAIARTTGNERGPLEILPSLPSSEYECAVGNDSSYCAHAITNSKPSLTEHSDNDLERKRAKRVLSNGQSAQRSRARKLQYILELEKIVNSLQMEVSSLSLQAIYLRHHWALLSMDNNALKEQVILFVEEKKKKDSQNELLKHHIQRLKTINKCQSLDKSQRMQQ